MIHLKSAFSLPEGLLSVLAEPSFANPKGVDMVQYRKTHHCLASLRGGGGWRAWLVYVSRRAYLVVVVVAWVCRGLVAALPCSLGACPLEGEQGVAGAVVVVVSAVRGLVHYVALACVWLWCCFAGVYVDPV